MKKILVVCQNYPSEKNPFSMPFIHYRLKEYLSHFQVKVLSFSASEDYEYEGVRVLKESTALKPITNREFDLYIFHAPNIRNHQRLVLSNLFNMPRMIFIFHGYEIIDIHKRIYSKQTHFTFPLQYSYLKKIYHKLKLPITSLFLSFISKITPCEFVFVSNTLLKEATEDLKRNFSDKNTSIIHNPINPCFQMGKYIPKHRYDYLCIRPFNDPKYGIDIFIELARRHPHQTFHLFGKGELPKELKTPSNLNIFEKFLKPDEIINMISLYRVAIMPTRWDSQGVLVCELSATGMPVVTSDIPVCREFLSSLRNVTFLDNESFHLINLDSLNLANEETLDSFLTFTKTIQREIDLILRIIYTERTP